MAKRLLSVWIALVLVAAVVAAVTQDSEGGGLFHRKPNLASACRAWDALTPKSSAPTVPTGRKLVNDPAVQVSALPNGMKVYVRHNERPGGSVSLRLVVQAGSVEQTKKRSGTAHFLEHMLFNGTKKYPRNELTSKLEGLGVQLGGDLNAATTYDSTTYHLDVSNEPAQVDTGIEILREWASRATLTPTEVKRERGVVLAELRRRRSGTGQRAVNRLIETVLAGTTYAKADPGGDEKLVAAMTSAQLRSFYRKWYRPKLMAVIAVGDVDAGEVTTKIKAAFADFKGVGPAPKPPPLRSATSGIPRLRRFTDPDATSSVIQMAIAREPAPPKAAGGVRKRMAIDIGFAALSRRLRDGVLRGTAPYFDAGSGTVPLTSATRFEYFELDSTPGKAAASTEALLAEIGRIRAHGFTKAEIKAAKANATEAAVRAGQNDTTAQDWEVADRLIDNFVAGAAFSSPAANSKIDMAAIKAVDVRVASAAFVRSTRCADLVLAIHGPVGSQDPAPDLDSLAAVIDRIAHHPKPQVAAVTFPDRAMTSAPAPVAPTERTTGGIEGEATLLTYPNGARAVIIPTPVVDGDFSFEAVSAGGFTRLKPADAPVGRAVSEIVDSSGAGRLNALELDRLVERHEIDLSAFLDETTEGFTGEAPTARLESLLQVLRARMTKPKVSAGALARYRQENAILAAHPERSFDDLGESAVAKARFGKDPRYQTLDTPAQLAKVTSSRVLQVYKSRFQNPGDFVFALVGDLDLEKTVNLLNRYVGSLKGTGKPETAEKVRPAAPAKVVKRTVHASIDPQASFIELFDAPISLEGAATDAHARVLELIVDERVRNKVREELGASYSPSISVTVARAPTAHIETRVDVVSAPGRLDEVEAAVHAAVDGLRSSGPDAGELQRAVQQAAREGLFYSNLSLIDDWTTGLLFGGQPDPAALYFATLDTTAAQVQSLARTAWPVGRHVEVRVLPRDR